MTESSICSVTTVHAAPEYTTVTVASTYTSSCPSARLEEHNTLATVTCTCFPEDSATDQISINKICINTSVEYSTETVTKTVMLISTISSFPRKDTCTLLVAALPPSIADFGYVETAECTFKILTTLAIY